MRLDTIIVADAAATAGGKLSILGAWTTRLTPPTFPWSEPISIIVRAFIEENERDDDPESPRRVTVSIEGPSGVELGQSEFRVSPGTFDSVRRAAIEGEAHAIVFTSSHYGMEFTGPGLFDVVVRFDGEEAGRYPLAVAEATPQAR